MGTRKSNEGAPAPVPTQSPQLPQRANPQDLATEAGALADLLRWVSEAQMTLSLVQNAAASDPELQEILGYKEIGYNSPVVHAKDLDFGMYFVHCRQLELIEQLGGGAA